MNDSQWTWFPAVLGDLAEPVALVVVLAAFGIRVFRPTRRWAPRGNAKAAVPGSAGRLGEPRSPRERAREFHRAPTGPSQHAHSGSPTPALRP